jgi:transposase
VAQVASNAGVAGKTVRAIARRYEEEGLESALFEKARPGKQRVLDAGQSQRIIAMVCGQPPVGMARWSVRLIAEEAVKRKLAPQVGRETIRVLLQSHELNRGGKKSWCIAELNEEYIARMEDVLALYEKPLSEREPVVCGTKSRWYCMRISALHGPCGRDGSRGVIPNTSAVERPTSSAASSPRQDGTLPKSRPIAPRRSSPITW